MRDPVCISEARVLCAVNADIAFTLSMLDRQTHSDVENIREAEALSNGYTALLKASGVEAPDLYSEEVREWVWYGRAVQSILYAERKGEPSGRQEAP